MSRGGTNELEPAEKLESSVSPTCLWILHRFWDLVFFHFDFSIFSIPHLFVDSAWILGLISEFGLFYLQYPPPICGFCMGSGVDF